MRRSATAVYVYGTVRLSDAESGRKPFLDSWSFAVSARTAVVGQVRFFTDGRLPDRRRIGAGQRFDAADADTAGAAASIDGGCAGSRTERLERRSGGHHAEFP